MTSFQLHHEHVIFDAHLQYPLNEEHAQQITSALVTDLLNLLHLQPLGPLELYPASDSRAPGWSFIQSITTSHISGHYFRAPGDYPHLRLDIYSCRPMQWQQIVLAMHKHCVLGTWTGTFIEREIDTGMRKTYDLAGDGAATYRMRELL